MKTYLLFFAMLISAVSVSGKSFKIEPLKTLPRQVLSDKIKGGWTGKVIGVAYGVPIQFKAQGKIYESTPGWKADQISEAFKQDDFYVQMTFLKVLEESGPDATCFQFGDALKDTKYELWHANAAARRNLNREMIAPWSGIPLYNAHTDDNDFQNESEFIGLMCPNLQIQSENYSIRIGRVSVYGDGLFGGMWIAGMYSAAFFQNDIRQVVQSGLERIPAESEYAAVLRDVLDWHKEDPNNWTNCWKKLEAKWAHVDLCPEGVATPYNVDAKLNGGYIAMGLLYGNGDFARTLEITARAGEDCIGNAGCAAGVLGATIGYEKIPDLWKAGLTKINDAKFLSSDYSLADVIKLTEKNALALIASVGGRTNDAEVAIPSLKPTTDPRKYQDWFTGIPDKRIPITDAAWDWKGDWESDKEGKASANPQSEATLKFNGSAVVLTGLLSPQGGRADVSVDGEDLPFPSMDAYAESNTHDKVIWHAFGLTNGTHTLRIVPRGVSDPRSSGKTIILSEAVIYRMR